MTAPTTSGTPRTAAPGPAHPADAHPIELERIGSHARACIDEHGAHLTHWRDAQGHERLYLSPRTRRGPGAAIRGGVPVIFPRFAELPAPAGLPRHGFARTQRWARVAEASPQPQRAVFRLVDDARTRVMWAASFEVLLQFDLGEPAFGEPASGNSATGNSEIAIRMQVRNTGAVPFRFTAALHTYLAVDDVRSVRIRGLDRCAFIDKCRPAPAMTPTTSTVPEASEAEPLRAQQPIPPESGGPRFGTEVDRIYLSVPRTLMLDESRSDQDSRPGLVIRSEGFEDCVVWNPGAGKARALDDLPDDDWLRFVCIEAAQIARPIELLPEQLWSGAQVLATGKH